MSTAPGAFDFIRAWSGGLGALLRRHADARPKTWRVVVVIIAAAVALFSQYPPYVFSPNGPQATFSGFARTPYGHALDWWLNHPLQPVPTETFFPPSVIADKTAAGPVSHCDKLAFRPFLPAIGRLTGGGFWTLIAANHIATILIFAFVYHICLRCTSSRTMATAATWAWAATWAGAWGFNDMVYGDAVAMALMLGALAAGRRPWLVGALVFIAGCTDERAICAAPMLALFRCWETRPPFAVRETPLDTRTRLRVCVAPVLLAVLAYCVCRLYVTLRLDLKPGTTMLAQSNMPIYHFYYNFPGTLFKVFECLWVWPLLLVANLRVAGPSARGSLLAFVGAWGLMLLPALMVWDFDRSVFYSFPALLAALCFGAGAASVRAQLAMILTVASFFWLYPFESWLGRLLD